MTAALFGGPASAAENSDGSKNFNVPFTVPNYFSNEAGPLQGPASETRRGTLYSNATAEEASPATIKAVAAVPRGRQHIAMAVPRGRVIRGRVAYTHGRAVRRGRPVVHAVAHGRRAHVERVVARTHPIAHHPTRVSSAHNGRG